MAEIADHLHRHDPDRNFQFRLKWDAHHIAGVTQCSGLRRVTEVIDYQEAGDPGPSRKLAGRTKFDANANAVAIEHIKIENEGWERDTTVTEPSEP